MGKFDGILICSDWDGTLFHKGQIPSESVNAIKYFQENGGLFTVCSGRAAAFLKKYEHYVKPNTYLLCINGACICDPESGEIIEEGFVGSEAYDIVDRILECGAKIKNVNVVKRGDDDIVMMPIEAYRAQRDELIASDVYKVTIGAVDAEDGELMSKTAANYHAKQHIAVRSFCSYIEILNKDHIKGIAAKRLKERVGARLLIGMGDFENDISLLRDADIGYAVGNAIDSVKAVADRVTARVEDSAVARVIEDLEREFCK